MFEEGITGTLMRMDKSDQTSLAFKIWFPFVRDHMKIIREGSLAAVKNFSSDKNTDCYSILRITSAMPTHYGLDASMSGYPGFTVEAAISASKDWSQDRPVEDTTKISCDAVPSRFEIKMTRLTLICLGAVTLSLVLTSTGDAKVDAKSIVGAWLFNENSGKKAEDSSGNRNHGTLAAGAKFV